MDTYDPEKKKYVSVWVDSMSARPLLLEGTYDKEKKTMTMTGEAPGPDGNPAKHKMVTHTPDNDHQTFTMYMVGPDGQETKVMTIEYTRKK
jgi:isopentenyldiphosphate isomerase